MNGRRKDITLVPESRQWSSYSSKSLILAKKCSLTFDINSKKKSITIKYHQNSKVNFNKILQTSIWSLYALPGSKINLWIYYIRSNEND